MDSYELRGMGRAIAQFHAPLCRYRKRRAVTTNPDVKTYLVNEMFVSIQGEGANVGHRAVFIRLSGCNLWSGREVDREKAICKFCDTQFLNWTKMTAEQIAERGVELWGGSYSRLAILTGGEPTLQVDDELIAALKDHCFRVAMESNGTRAAPKLDWLCISPKAGSRVVQKDGDELKVVWPQPLDLDELGHWTFRHFYLQPMDGNPDAVPACLAEIHRCPQWKLSLQIHKLLGLR